MIKISDFNEDYKFTRFDGTEISKADIREDIINYYIDAQIEGNTRITDFNKGSEAYHLCDLLSELMMDLYSTINDNTSSILVHECTGEILDNYGDMRGIYRIGGSPATLELTLKRKDGVSEDIYLYNGTNIITQDSISFSIDLDDDEYIIIPSTGATVEALCLYDGTLGNLDGDVTFIIEDDEVQDKVEITRFTILEEGVDDEDDDHYRNRILNNGDNYPVGSVEWYQKVALDTNEDGSPNLRDVYVDFGILNPDEGLECIYMWFKPDNYEPDTLIYDEDIPVEYLETNSYGENKRDHIMFKGRADLVYQFLGMKYKVVNHHLRLLLSIPEDIPDFADWKFRVILDYGYALTDEIRKKIRDKAQEYINNLKIGEPFTPTLCNEAVKELDEVLDCKIYSGDSEVFDIIDPALPYNSVYANTENTTVEEAVLR